MILYPEPLGLQETKGGEVRVTHNQAGLVHRDGNGFESIDGGAKE